MGTLITKKTLNREKELSSIRMGNYMRASSKGI